MKKIINVFIMGLFSLSCFAQTPQSTDIDPATGARTWSTHAYGVHLSLTQILPEQVQAFYVNRGFTLKQIEAYATSCVYMTVLRNDNAPGTIHFTSNSWPVLHAGKKHKLLSVDQWLQRLTTINTNKSALVAFKWAQFPPEQEYEPGGDWNQGMLSIGLPPESEFNIIARWDIDGKIFETELQKVKCAK